MARITSRSNPFTLMMNPEIVLAAIERSERLGQLNRRICRPLDRPLLGAVNGGEPPQIDEDDSEESDLQ
ncbi:hypothetical protein [Rubrivivax gelatinosus]|uniref:hypothetical protein n=1 Tax=Rubrivivax gelatinosus TaxID=28068 RepID=UPI0002DC20DD|nr:hypothetical protein [Rubrivivax gelatinosus]MBG6082470.1 hypothetical protein [Rubrivivax gelatinosus]